MTTIYRALCNGYSVPLAKGATFRRCQQDKRLNCAIECYMAPDAPDVAKPESAGGGAA